MCIINLYSKRICHILQNGTFVFVTHQQKIDAAVDTKKRSRVTKFDFLCQNLTFAKKQDVYAVFVGMIHCATLNKRQLPYKILYTARAQKLPLSERGEDLRDRGEPTRQGRLNR